MGSSPREPRRRASLRLIEESSRKRTIVCWRKCRLWCTWKIWEYWQCWMKMLEVQCRYTVGSGRTPSARSWLTPTVLWSKQARQFTLTKKVLFKQSSFASWSEQASTHLKLCSSTTVILSAITEIALSNMPKKSMIYVSKLKTAARIKLLISYNVEWVRLCAISSCVFISPTRKMRRKMLISWLSCSTFALISANGCTATAWQSYKYLSTSPTISFVEI